MNEKTDPDELERRLAQVCPLTSAAQDGVTQASMAADIERHLARTREREKDHRQTLVFRDAFDGEESLGQRVEAVTATVFQILYKNFNDVRVGSFILNGAPTCHQSE